MEHFLTNYTVKQINKINKQQYETMENLTKKFHKIVFFTNETKFVNRVIGWRQGLLHDNLTFMIIVKGKTMFGDITKIRNSDDVHRFIEEFYCSICEDDESDMPG